MSEIGQNLKEIVKKGINAIGNTANSFAASAKQKVDAYNLENRKNEVFADIGKKICLMHKEGKKIPEEVMKYLGEIEDINRELDRIKKEKEAASSEEIKTKEENVESYAENADCSEKDKRMEYPSAAEYTAKDNQDVPVLEIPPEECEDGKQESCPLSSAINDLFEELPPVDKMVDKVNSSLDELGSNLRRFSGEFGKQLDEFADQISGKNEDDPRK